MIKLFKNLFSNSNCQTEESKQKNELKNFEILKYDGIRAQRIGKWIYAEKCFKEAIRINPELETMELLVRTSLQLNKLDQAEDILQQMTGISPQQAGVYIELAHIYDLKENYNEMLNAAQKANELEPENEYAYYQQAQAYHKQNDVINAIRTLTLAIARKEDFIAAYLMRGKILLNLKQLSEVEADINILLEKTPDNEDVLLLAGDFWRYKNNKEKAISYYKQVIESNPFNEKGYELAALLFIDNKEWQNGMNLLNEGIENCEAAILYQLRGLCRLETGDKEGSMADMKKVMELNPNTEKEINGQFNNFENIFKSNNPLG